MLNRHKKLSKLRLDFTYTAINNYITDIHNLVKANIMRTFVDKCVKNYGKSLFWGQIQPSNANKALTFGLG